jgi:hypothetical protein
MFAPPSEKRNSGTPHVEPLPSMATATTFFSAPKVKRIHAGAPPLDAQTVEASRSTALPAVLEPFV